MQFFFLLIDMLFSWIVQDIHPLKFRFFSFKSQHNFVLHNKNCPFSQACVYKNICFTSCPLIYLSKCQFVRNPYGVWVSTKFAFNSGRPFFWVLVEKPLNPHNPSIMDENVNEVCYLRQHPMVGEYDEVSEGILEKLG